MAKIHGFNKLTLLDYPGRLAATIFLGSCNFPVSVLSQCRSGAGTGE